MSRTAIDLKVLSCIQWITVCYSRECIFVLNSWKSFLFSYFVLCCNPWHFQLPRSMYVYCVVYAIGLCLCWISRSCRCAGLTVYWRQCLLMHLLHFELMALSLATIYGLQMRIFTEPFIARESEAPRRRYRLLSDANEIIMQGPIYVARQLRIPQDAIPSIPSIPPIHISLEAVVFSWSPRGISWIGLYEQIDRSLNSIIENTTRSNWVSRRVVNIQEVQLSWVRLELQYSVRRNLTRDTVNSTAHSKRSMADAIDIKYHFDSMNLNFELKCITDIIFIISEWFAWYVWYQ